MIFGTYELESKVAEYPRIVIGQERINYLTQLTNGHKQLPEQDKEDIDLCKLMATRCLKMIVQDLDGVPILDYLGKEFFQGAMLFLVEIPGSPKIFDARIVYMPRSQTASTIETSVIFPPLTVCSFCKR